VAPLLDVRPQDRRNTGVAFIVLFALMTGHSMLETARDALFLSSLPVEHLPWCYLSIAVLAVLAATANRALANKVSRRTLLAATLFTVTVITAGLWMLLGMRGAVMAYVAYIWTGLVATVVVVQFWLLLSDLFTVSQAKRVYALIGAGALLGATAGSALAGALLLSFDSRDLLLVASGVFLLAGLAPALFRPPQDEAGVPRPDEMSRGGAMSLVQRHPYLRRLLALVLLATVSMTGVDYVFKSTVAERIAPAELGVFFAQVYAALNGVALIVQLVLASWLVRVAGVSRSLLVMPTLVLVGALAFIVGPALITVLILKGTDGALRHSVNRTATELLYVPLSSDIRHRFKAFIDAVGQRGGQALASVAILVALAAGASTRHLALAVIATASAWLVTVIGLKDHYLELFRQQLRAGTIDARSELPALDLHSLEALMETLNSADDSEVISALDMLAEQRRTNLIPALLLYHPSQDVVLRALDLLAESGRTDFVGVCDRLLDDGPGEVRAAALRARTRAMPDENLLRSHLENDCGYCRITAIVGLVAAGFERPGDRLDEALRGLIDADDPGARLVLARAIAKQPDKRLGWVLQALASDADPAVRVEVARAVTVMPDPRFLPVLLPMLSMRRVRPDAREAILGMGRPALAALGEALESPRTDIHVRRHLPRTISRFRHDDAARILTSRLPRERDGMTRFKILRGLRRMQLDNPRIALDVTTLRNQALSTLQRAIDLLSWSTAMRRDFAVDTELRTRGSELLLSLIDEKRENAIERVFRMLGLLEPHEDFRLIYSGLRSANPKTRASSRELVEHLVEPSMRDAVRALTDNVTDERKLAAASEFYAPPALDYVGRLQLLLNDGSETLRSIAAYHVGELQMHELRDELLSSEGDHRLLRDVIDRALSMLSPPEPSHAG